MKKYVARKNVCMRNPYALADYIDLKHGRCKKDWNKILLKLEKNPKFMNVSSALIDSLRVGYPVWFKKHAPQDLFNPKTGSPLYCQKQGKKQGKIIAIKRKAK